MSTINKALEYLGKPYQIKTIDTEPVVYRNLNDFEFEVSGLHKSAVNCTIYVWQKKPYQKLIGIYNNIQSIEDLKDLLGYCSVKYQNLFSRIHVEREDQIG